MKKEVTETEFWDKFHEKHNPGYHAKKKTTKKEAKDEKKSSESYSAERHTIRKSES